MDFTKNGTILSVKEAREITSPYLFSDFEKQNLDFILELALSLSNAVSGSLLLKGEERLVLVAGRNLHPSYFGERVKNLKSVSEMVFKKGIPIIVGGENSSLYIPMRKREDQFSLSFPILNSDGQVIGVLNLNRDTRPFDKEGISVVQKIASAIALLLEENTLRRGRERLLLVFSEVVNLFEKKDYLFQEELVYQRIFLAVQLLLEIREGAIFKLSPRRPYLVFSHCWPPKMTLPKLEAHFGKEWDEGRVKVIDISWNDYPKKFLLLPIYGNLGWRFLFVSLVKRDLEPLEFLILSMIAQLGKSCLDTILLFRQNEKLAQDREKNQLARELHDGLAQILASSQIYLHFLKNNQDPEDERLQKDVLEKLESLIRMGIEESRFILSELSGKPVSAFRLRRELEEIINVFACPGLSIHRELKINVRLISFRVFRTLTAIAREVLSNVAKHSGAQNVWIHLHNDKQFFFLNIKDDGRGFLPDISSKDEKTGHFGIYNIKKRVKLVHGRIRFCSSNQGTTIEAKIPLNERYIHAKGKSSSD